MKQRTTPVRRRGQRSSTRRQRAKDIVVTICTPASACKPLWQERHDSGHRTGFCYSFMTEDVIIQRLTSTRKRAAATIRGSTFDAAAPLGGTASATLKNDAPAGEIPETSRRCPGDALRNWYFYQTSLISLFAQPLRDVIGKLPAPADIDGKSNPTEYASGSIMSARLRHLQGFFRQET